MYDVQTPAGMTPSTFSVRNEDVHKAMKKPSAPAYTMSSMKELEPMNDECSAILIEKMEKYVGQDINLGDWLHVSINPISQRDISPTDPPSGTPST